jgi:ParB family transcriptional regulator, chromosome partitioning protein
MMSSKADKIRRESGLNIAESVGGAGGLRYPAGMDPSLAVRKPANLEGVQRETSALKIEVGRIARDPTQPREDFDPEALGRLADSLKKRGQLQPIRVRWDDVCNSYVVLVGERRWRAAKLAGLSHLSCVVHDGPLGDGERLSIQLVENAVREDLKPVEQARAFRALMDLNGWSGNRLAKELHVSQPSVSKALALLGLPEAVQDEIDAGRLAPSAATEIARLPTPDIQEQVSRAVVENRMTRSEATDAVRSILASRPEAEVRPQPVTIDVGDGVVVKVTFRKATTTTAIQALRKAARMAQGRSAGEEAA